MRVLITGGAGFIGSHLADAYLERGDEVSSSTTCRPAASTTSRTSSSNPRFHYTIDSVHNEPLVAELVDRVRRGLPPGRGGRREADRREPGAHDRDQRARHRGRAAAGEQEEEEVLIASTSEVYGLSTEVPFREDGNLVHGRDDQGPLELRLLQGDRRVPGAGLLAREEAADGRRPAVQHRRAAADRPVRHGHSDLRQAGAAGRPITVYGDGSRRAASATSATWSARCMALMDHPEAVGQVFNIGSSEEVIDRRRWPSGSRR